MLITEVEGLMFSNDDDMLNDRRAAPALLHRRRTVDRVRRWRNLTADAEVEALRLGTAGEACSARAPTKTRC